MKKVLLLIIIIFFINGCIFCNKKVVECPVCEPEVVYKRVYVPYYVNVLDNVTIEEPHKLSYFEFSKDGDLCMDENNFKLMLENIILLKNDVKYYHSILLDAKNSK